MRGDQQGQDRRGGPRNRTVRRLGPSGLRVADRLPVVCERISQEIAAKTFTELDKAGYTTPKKLADADWQALVDVLGRGGYRRYDESTARELISIGKYILESYDGSMSKLREEAGGTKKAITNRIQEFKGVGPTAAKISMREIWPLWSATD